MPQTKVRLKDIPNLLVNKLPVENKILYTDDDMTAKYCAEHGNAIIDQMSERALTINREKLIELLNTVELDSPYGESFSLKFAISGCTGQLAYSIILALPELLESIG